MSHPTVRRGRMVIAALAVAAVAAISLPMAVAQASRGPVPSLRSAAHDSSTVVHTRRSWNQHVRCRATVTTLSKVLGNRTNRNGGATFRGGHFRPGIPDKTAFRPPCRRRGVTTFVQLNRVRLGSCSKINPDGDWTCNLTDPTVRRGRTADMSQIHVETDQSFRTAGGWTKPPGGTLVDVQGFVYWDPGHVTAAWHHFSGWEIHSLTAWRHSPKRH